MKSYITKCLIGKIEYDPRRKFGKLYTSNKWKVFLDKMWGFFGRESRIPVDTTDDERYYIIYSSLKDFSVRALFIIAVIGTYLAFMRCSAI